jgi:sorting nexin-4
MNDDDDNFTSITWENADDAKAAAGSSSGHQPSSSAAASSSQTPTSGVDLVLGTQNLVDPYSRPRVDADHGRPRWEGYLMVQVTEARKEHEGTKEMFVSYGIRAEVSFRY